MSFFIQEPECSLDVHEVSSEDTWVKCRLQRGRISIVIFAVIIVLVLVLLWAFSSTYLLAVGVGGALILGLMVAYQYFLALPAAQNEHRVAVLGLKHRMDSGMSRAETLRNLQEESLKKAEIAQSQTNAGMNLLGMANIARSLRR